MTLAALLSVGEFTAHVSDHGDTVDVWWTHPTLTPGGCVDFKHPDSVAEALIVRSPIGAEWVRMMVQASARRNGIMAACMAVPRSVFEENGLWPALVSEASLSPQVYMDAGMDDDPDRPGMLILNPERVKEQRAR